MPRALRPTWLISLRTLAGEGRISYRGPASDHFDGQHFRNIQPTPLKTLRALLKWQFNREPQAPWIEQPAANDQAPLTERVNGSELRVTYINHATVLLQHRGLNILTDPVWAQRVSPFTFAGPRRYQQPGLSLVSHNHYDHLDLHSLRGLCERFPLARVVSGLGNGALIRSTGFAHVDELDWWQSLPLGNGLELHGVPVQHWSSRTRADTNRTLWMGFVITSPEGPLLFPGDTGLGPEFALINQRFGPMRFAALPIGAYAPRWFMRDHHMNPDDAVQAHQQLQSRHSLAIHFGTFNLTDEGQFAPPRDLAIALAERQVDPDTFRVPTPGYQWVVPPL